MSDDAESESSDEADVISLEEAPIDLEEFLEALDEEARGDARALVDYIEELHDDLEEAEAEIDDLTSRLKRARADFENYKKRVKRRKEEERQEANRRLVDRLVDVRQNLQRSLDVEEQSLDDLLEGVKLTLRDIDRLLDAEDVQEIDPDLGDPVDPHRHEVMVKVESDQPADTIAEVFEPGYLHGETVLREAKVTVSTGPSDTDDSTPESSE